MWCDRAETVCPTAASRSARTSACWYRTASTASAACRPTATSIRRCSSVNRSGSGARMLEPPSAVVSRYITPSTSSRPRSGTQRASRTPAERMLCVGSNRASSAALPVRTARPLLSTSPAIDRLTGIGPLGSGSAAPTAPRGGSSGAGRSRRAAGWSDPSGAVSSTHPRSAPTARIARSSIRPSNCSVESDGRTASSVTRYSTCKLAAVCVIPASPRPCAGRAASVSDTSSAPSPTKFTDPAVESRSPSENSRADRPSASRSPSASGPSWSGRPFTEVPLALPRSATRQPPGEGRSSACRRETSESRSRRSLAVPRPITTGAVAPDGRANRRPASGPAVTSSDGPAFGGPAFGRRSAGAGGLGHGAFAGTGA